MKVLVTGATGEVGKHVTARLLADGVAVRALCRSRSDVLPREVEVTPGDLTAPQTLERAVSGLDAVVHCAAHLGSGGRALHGEINVGGTRAARGGAARPRRPHPGGLRPQVRRQFVRPADGYDPFPRAARRLCVVEDRRRLGPLFATMAYRHRRLRPGIVYGGRRDFVARVARGASPAARRPRVAGDVATTRMCTSRRPCSRTAYSSVPAEPLDWSAPTCRRRPSTSVGGCSARRARVPHLGLRACSEDRGPRERACTRACLPSRLATVRAL